MLLKKRLVGHAARVLTGKEIPSVSAIVQNELGFTGKSGMSATLS